VERLEERLSRRFRLFRRREALLGSLTSSRVRRSVPFLPFCSDLLTLPAFAGQNITLAVRVSFVLSFLPSLSVFILSFLASSVAFLLDR
jgi:hypothetical protein